MAVNSGQAGSGDSGGERGQLSQKERIEHRQRDISEAIDDLENTAPNEQVEALAELLRQMDIELKRLEARNRQLTSRLKKVEAVNGLTGIELTFSDTSTLDHRDEKVVKAIVADELETVTLADLQELYRNHTDIRDRETLRSRIKDLTRRGPFEHERLGMQTSVWRFTGLTDSSE
ncbi:hypothetical protein [Natrialba taiwanensis]|uniref:Uncharacterized protein n=1 Tax=Natrialba taiwanensis DSM 12281 TaxID=1230458 RepID=L9ZK82_9EURY|nr:hypothetical protein [Natrialba taiwanensis]ELY86451.1 hypothetical protein C484_18282 [Natrialba taiwanensis DSM 12281]